MPMHRTDSFIVNVADPEYTKKMTLKINCRVDDAVLEYIY